MATGMLIHDDRYLRNIFFSLIYLGVIVVLFVPGSSYFGYTIVAAGLLMIILVFFEYIIHDSVKNSSSSNYSKLFNFLYALVNDGTPVFMVFGIVIYLLAITMTYNANIVAGDVTPQYINFRNISAIFLVIEAILLNTYLGEKRRIFVGERNSNSNSNNNSNSNSNSKSFGARTMKLLSKNVGIGLITILFAMLHILVVIIIDMNLRYFTTEGFSQKKKLNNQKDKHKEKRENEKKERK